MSVSSKAMVVYITILLVFTGGCRSNVSEVKEFSEDGLLYRSFYLDQDSIIQGVLKTYYEDGKRLFEEANYVDGQLDGQRTLYFDSGQPEIIENYKRGVLIDTLRVFYHSGQLKRYEIYQAGVLSGSVNSYYEDGILKESVIFAHNEENGPFSEYHPNGHLKWQGNFLNGGNEYGELLQYDTTGTLIRKMMCDSFAICTTFWTKEGGSFSQE